MTEARALTTKLMEEYAEATGIVGSEPPRRYLWTDAFGVCTFLGLARRTGNDGYEEAALALVDQVHGILGRHREDDAREGWISGLSEEEGNNHPTRGGLRIGKKLPERGKDEPFDERLEWERDGQYFHYLTRWMHALHQVFGHTGKVRYLAWARELAVAGHRGFTHEGPGGQRRMVWKMSIDLSRPLVPSSGAHDPLDGLITDLELQTAPSEARSTARTADPDAAGPDLRPIITEAETMCLGARWTTPDPLGIGGLLTDASRLAGIITARGLEDDLLQSGGRSLLERLLQDSLLSLGHFAPSFDPLAPATRRLAFRELGLSIGLHALERAHALPGLDEANRSSMEAILKHSDLAEDIEAFWSDPDHRRASTWLDHADINTVMLATSLAPEGYVSLPS